MKKHNFDVKQYKKCKDLGKMYCPLTNGCRTKDNTKKECLDNMGAYYYYNKNSIEPYYINDDYLGDYNINEYKDKIPKNIKFYKKGELINILTDSQLISNVLDIDVKDILQNIPEIKKILEQNNINTISELKEIEKILKNRPVINQEYISRNIPVQTKSEESEYDWTPRVNNIPSGPPPPPSLEQLQQMKARNANTNMLAELTERLKKRALSNEGSGLFGGYYYPGYYYDPFYSHFVNGKYVG